MNAMATTINLRAAPVRLAGKATVRRSASLRRPAGRVVAKAAPGSSEPAKSESSVETGRLALLATVASNPVLFGAQEAFAKGGEFGIFEGRTMALIHPLFLGGLWFATVYAGYLGLQWRKVRTVGEEIQDLKKEIPAAVPAAVTANGEVEAAAAPSMTAAQLETKKKIDELTAERKELIAGNYKEKHNNWGSLLLAFGVTLAVEGGMNTYLRTGKLFPGPHLYAGMAITCLWAMAAGLVPEMQRGNQKARDLHIALNCVNLALFTWQIPTGLEIVGKVFQFTSWP